MRATTTCLTGLSLRCRPSPTSAVIAPDLGRPELGGRNAPNDRAMSRQRKHGELAAERCIVLQGGIATDGTQALGRFRETGGKTDAGPAADTGQDRNVLLATMLIGGHVSDDAGRC